MSVDTHDHEHDVRRELGLAIRIISQGLLRLEEQRARKREQQRRQAERESDERRRNLQARFAAEQAAAEAQLQVVFQTGFYEGKAEQRIAETYALARGWAEHSPLAESAAATMRRDVFDLTGVDLEARRQNNEAEERDRAQRERRVVADVVAADETAQHSRDENEGDRNAGRDPHKDLNLREMLIASGMDEEAVQARMTALGSFPKSAFTPVKQPPRPGLGKRGRSPGRSQDRERGLER